MSDPSVLDPIRASFLARIDAKLDGAPVPGGDLAAWLAPLSTAALAGATFVPPPALREALFKAVGTARADGGAHCGQNLLDGDPAGVVLTPLTDGALNAWSACALARDLLAHGLAADAKRITCNAARSSLRWPEVILRRFGPQLAAIHDEAERMRARQLADEVA